MGRAYSQWDDALYDTFRCLAYHDALYDGSANDFWTWLIPRTTWFLTQDEWEGFFEGLGRYRCDKRISKELLDRCVRKLTRLEQRFPTTIQRVDVFVPKCFHEYYEEEEHKLGYLLPYTDLVGHAVEVFRDRLSSFRILIDGEHWSCPDNTLSAVWGGTQEIPFVDYQSDWRMVDIQAQFQRPGRHFSVVATLTTRWPYWGGETVRYERVVTDLWSRHEYYTEFES